MGCAPGCTDCPTCRGEVQPDAPVMKDMAFAMAMVSGPLYADTFLGPLSVAQIVRDGVRGRRADVEGNRILDFLDRVLTPGDPHRLLAWGDLLPGVSTDEGPPGSPPAPSPTPVPATPAPPAPGPGKPAAPPVVPEGPFSHPSPGVTYKTEYTCCCPLVLRIYGNGPLADGSKGSFLLDPEFVKEQQQRDQEHASKEQYRKGNYKDRPYAGHSLRIAFEWDDLASGTPADCTIVWNEISDRSMAGYERVNGTDAAYELSIMEWHDLKLVNPRSSTFREWNAVFGAPAARGYPAIAPRSSAARKLPSGRGYHMDLEDNPAFPLNEMGPASRELEAEVKVQPGCKSKSCEPLTARFRQKVKWKGGKLQENYFTHSGDTDADRAVTGPHGASVAEGQDGAEYRIWRSGILKKWSMHSHAWEGD